MPDPIEIRPEDIIRRPANLVPNAVGKAAGEGGGFSIKNLKGYIQQFKEIKDLAESLGVDLSSLGLKMPGQKKEAAPADARVPALTGVQQIRNFLKLLQAKYGDITVNELLEKLKAEFGDWKISNFTKGGIV
jgi:hypothetical protein